jgi:hypothetical protein
LDKTEIFDGEKSMRFCSYLTISLLMMTFVALQSFASSSQSFASATTPGACVTLKGEVSQEGFLDVIPAWVYHTSSLSGSHIVFAKNQTFTVGDAFPGNVIQLIGTPGFEGENQTNAGKLFGFADANRFMIQEQSMCD